MESGYTLDFSALKTAEYLNMLASGVTMTIIMAAISGLLSLLLGYLIVLLTTSKRSPVKKFASAYTELFRNVPALIQILFWSFAFPAVFPLALRQNLFFDNSLVDLSYSYAGVHPYYFLAVILGITLNTSAYVADILRSGVNALPVEQTYAGLSCGLTKRQIIHEILLPQGIIVGLPPLTSRLIHNMKNTALAVFLPVPELFSQVQTISSKTFRGIEVLIVGGILYLAMSLLISIAMSLLQKKWQYINLPQDNKIWIN